MTKLTRLAACLMLFLIPADATACAPATHAAVWEKVAAIETAGTLILEDGRRVRLYGIDVPSTAARLAGDAAAPEIDRLRPLTIGQRVLIAVRQQVDRHGRLPALVYLPDGRLLQIELLVAGAARMRLLPEEDDCREQLQAAEARARVTRRGLWASPEYAIRSAQDSSLVGQIGLYQLVAGRVLSVGSGRSMHFLDFGRDYQQDFTIMVPLAVAKSLAGEGMPVESFKGRRVLVRGVIEESGGPAIRLGHVSDIELLD